MSQQRRGLGKGLGALIPQGPAAPAPVESAQEAPAPTEPTPEPAVVPAPNELPDGTYIEEIALTSITPNPRQPRTHFDEEALEELRDSIVEVGLLQPIVVRKVQGEEEPLYELIMGERRFRASKSAGLDRVPAIVRRTEDDELLREALLENLHRQQLNPLEEAAAYQQMLDDFGTTQEELAQSVGKSRSHISNTLRLLHLPGKVQTRVAAGVLSAGHARALLSVDDGEAQERLAERVNKEGLSVRALEEIVSLRRQGHDVDEAEKSRRSSGRLSNPPQIEEWASSFGDRLDTTVKVDIGRRKGKIVVEFATMEDLERIIKQIER
ncbi:ParB/RepB/Spo0J family partition protein [Nocardiopsis sp. MG754419]|uniref:ParB/RepB/Spo0J family partition protein n=1 Tax=Nocardiopsis sp. MG754419 TaxID=2259865 RepID=UPI001BA528A0|nr:ParB/RepB/Spo0J family partition protein [Nocardiopsis sp. MG754419]MBR8741386.1 chromosome partitioning protein ParB [Nocardiopsis sp. MG754419]